jgi:thiamine biosynthesis lipoprotein ApbE
VVAPTAVEAEVLAKSIFLAGEEAAAAATVPALLVTQDGRTVIAGGLA